MVDIALPVAPANTHASKFAPHVRLPYMVEVVVSPEKMIAAKGGAIAAADVYDLVKLPGYTVVQNVWLKVSKVFEGTATNLTVNVGVTGVEADRWVDGWDVDGAAVGAFAPASTNEEIKGHLTAAAGTTITLLVDTLTGTWTGGELRLYVQCLDLSNEPQAGIAQLYT